MKENQTLKKVIKSAQLSIESFQKLIEGVEESKAEQAKSFTNSWEKLVQDKKLMTRCSFIKNIEGVFGFGNEFSSKLSIDQNMQIAFQRLAELSLARDILRSYRLEVENEIATLERIKEAKTKTCDFRLTDRPVYFESKFTSNLNPLRLKKITTKAVNQIHSTDPDKEKLGAVIWIYSYCEPENSMKFQDIIEKITFQTEFPLTINVTLYNYGVYGYGDIVY